MTARRTEHAAWCLFVAAWVLGACVFSARASDCRDDISLSDGYRVKSVRIESRWGWTPKLALPIAPGDLYDPAKVSLALETVNDALKDQRRQQPAQLRIKGAVSVFYATTCTQIAGDKLVEVVIRIFALGLDVAEVGSATLPLPRSNRPTFFSEVPKPLLAFNPTFGIGQDRAFGASGEVGAAVDLLNLPAMLSGAPVTVSRNRLQLEARGRKSLSESFYDSNLRLDFSRDNPGKVLERFNVAGSFAAERTPQGDASFFRNAAQVGFGVRIRPPTGFIRKIAADAKFRWSANRVATGAGVIERTNEAAYEGRVVLDGRIGTGFTRAAVWFDGGSPEALSGSYHRVVATVGYANEIGISKNSNQTLGIEAVGGFGRAFGTVPRYGRFYGGNGLNNFLYDGVESPALTTLPTGPLLRSFGKGQAGAGGATGFWHVNLNVAVPLPGLSRPLIPNLDLNEGSDPPILLRTVLKKSTGSARSYLILQFMEEGAAQPEAERRADAVLRDVRPALTFLADRANLYAVKPLFLFDVANVRGLNDAGPRTRFGIGGGVQFTLVVARFEVGYLRTVRALPGDNRGNFFLRLTFQNLF